MTNRTRCQVFNFEDYTEPQPQVPAKHTAISQLVGEWERDDRHRAALEAGRQWVADAFYSEDGDTVRTLRLHKGWSQARAWRRSWGPASPISPASSGVRRT